MAYRPSISDFGAPATIKSKCQQCRAEGPSGTRGGCLKCGKVKFTRDGKKRVKQEQDA